MTDSATPHESDRSARLKPIVDQVLDSYAAERGIHHLDSTFLPSRDKTVDALETLRRIIFPGFFDERRVSSDNVREHVTALIERVSCLLEDQVRQALRYELNRTAGRGVGDNCSDCDARARDLTGQFLSLLPELRHKLALDVRAAFDGDPAAVSTDEAIFCYPGLDAVFTYRVAHELWQLGVPMLPRMMTEYAHNETGIDIHPGAKIGLSFFIDHGTGVVIGETCTIGDRVKIYQGVTLGALSTKGGQSWRGMKRHPDIEDDVTIYPNATILGGQTRIGARSVVNGSVFLTQAVPPDHTVRIEHPRPQLRARRPRRGKKSDALSADTRPSR